MRGGVTVEEEEGRRDGDNREGGRAGAGDGRESNGDGHGDSNGDGICGRNGDGNGGRNGDREGRATGRVGRVGGSDGSSRSVITVGGMEQWGSVMWGGEWKVAGSEGNCI